MYYVYFLKSRSSNWVYVGSTSDLQQRFRMHNAGTVKSTKPYKPFDLVYYEAYTTLAQARSREMAIKKNSQQKEMVLKRLKY